MDLATEFMRISMCFLSALKCFIVKFELMSLNTFLIHLIYMVTFHNRLFLKFIMNLLLSALKVGGFELTSFVFRRNDADSQFEFWKLLQNLITNRDTVTLILALH